MQKCRLTLQVTDVLAVAIRKLRSNFSNRQNVVEENSIKGKARLLFSGTRGREQRPQQLPFVRRSTGVNHYIFS